jgi:hypothetical protein
VISGFPVAKEDVALIVDDEVPQPRWSERYAPARDPCWNRSGCSRSTQACRSAMARSRWPTPSDSGLRTVP